MTGLITNYVNSGLASARPATPSVATGAFGMYYATDTGVASIYAGGSWNPITAGSVAWGSVTGTLSSQTDLNTALTGKLAVASNLSDVASASTSRTNLKVNRRNFVMTLSGSALASSEVLMAITPVGDETLAFAGNMANSAGKAMTTSTNPGSTFTGNIVKNGSTTGTWVISTGGVVSFTTTAGSAISLAPGDILEFVGPSTVSTAVGFTFSIAATASGY